MSNGKLAIVKERKGLRKKYSILFDFSESSEFSVWSYDLGKRKVPRSIITTIVGKKAI